MTLVLLVLATWFNWFVLWSSLAGIVVTIYSVMEGIFMIWDKFRYGIPIFWVP